MEIFQREASLIAVLLISIFSVAVSAESNCDDRHSIESVTFNGTVLKLEDGSVWEIDAADATKTIRWMPTTTITVCDCKPGDNNNGKACKITNHENGIRIDATLVE